MGGQPNTTAEGGYAPETTPEGGEAGGDTGGDTTAETTGETTEKPACRDSPRARRPAAKAAEAKSAKGVKSGICVAYLLARSPSSGSGQDAPIRRCSTPMSRQASPWQVNIRI